MSSSEVKSLASQRLKFQLTFTVLFAAAGLVLTWLILADSSPFHDYFIWHVSVPNLWGMTVLFPYVLGALLSGNPHSPSTLVIMLFTVIQWLIVGLLFSIPFSRVWLRVRK